MATYLEIFALASDPNITDLRKKIKVAIAVKAQLIAETPTTTAAQKSFAQAALRDPGAYEQLVLNYVLADNVALTTSQISGASDSAVQTAVNTAVDNLLGA